MTGELKSQRGITGRSSMKALSHIKQHIRHRIRGCLFTPRVWVFRWAVGWAKVFDGFLEVATLALYQSWLHIVLFDCWVEERNRAIKKGRKADE